MSTGMIIDGVAASEAVDSSGEVLDIKGCDISELEEGRGVLNWEHRGEESAGASANDIVGEIIFACKIFSLEDCQDERQRKYWKLVKMPFIYIQSELFDGDGDHEGAKSMAAMIRHYKTRGKSILVRYSIEGSTLSKDGNKLARCVARRVACTIKPCNRSCASDVISDPNSPVGPVDYNEKADLLDFEAKKSEYQHPMFTKLGGSHSFEIDPEIETPVQKALAAGNTAAAPGTLVGGAALQREDSGLKRMRNTALAAIRDYPGSFTRAEFKDFAKSKMPEASDSFLEHFADLAEDYHVRKKLTKKEGSSVTPAQIKEIAAADAPAPVEKKGKPAQVSLPGMEASKKATIRGVQIEANPTIKRPVFDEEKGVLHAPFGSFPLYKPDAAHFDKILSDPKVEEVHNQAMKGWVRAHKMLKEGRVAPEVVAHAALFAQLSPNTPVPMQEHMYAHLVDSMRATGADPTQPGFSDKTKADWVSRDQPQGYPEHSREFFTGHPGIHLQNASKLTGRNPGDIGGFMLANDKMKNMDRYHAVHQPLVDLINKNGRDVRSTASEMMGHKHLGQLWDAKRQTALSGGKPDIGPYAGPAISGLAPKTSRYMLGMIGGGNVFVPDTHMVRHLTGLEQRADPATIPLLKNLFWNEMNSNVLEGIDRWYAKNHPAVQHMVNHPTWGKHFDKPEDAIFPAFWKHWIGIAPDERSRGMYNQNNTEGTTHAPFWNAINPYLDQVEKGEDATPLPERTAKVHAQYVKDYGEVPASMLFHAFLLPHLLDAAEQREKNENGLTFMAKTVRADLLDIALRKAVAEFESHPTLLEPEMPSVHNVHIKIGEQHHPAGRYMIVGGNLHHLEDNHGILGRFLPQGPVTDATVSRIHGLKMSPHLRIEQADLSTPHTTDASPPQLPTAPAQVQRPSVFHYTRVGHDRPHVLEVQNGEYTLDGKRLSYPEVHTIVTNIKNRAAVLRYRDSSIGERVTKMEEDLLKALRRPMAARTPPAAGRMDYEAAQTPMNDRQPPAGQTPPPAAAPSAEIGSDPGAALQHIRAAVAAGHIHPDVERALTAHIYTDPMTGLGNKYAADEFKAKQRPGVYVGLDGTDFSSVNNTFGHAVGDQAIKAYGGAVRSALDEAAPGVGKAFRAGGDEMLVHLPSHEHAAKFARALHQHLSTIPAINGTHKLSAGMGIGLTPEHADKALYAAKEQKYLPGQEHITARDRKRAFPVGKAPNMAHSLVPGHEGPLPLNDDHTAGVQRTLATVQKPAA